MLLEAEQLAAKFSMQFGAPTLDVIHVAAALSLNAEEFCTTDLRQAKLASQVQLKVVIP
jgi:predicted nucleic acid-binding protein